MSATDSDLPPVPLHDLLAELPWVGDLASLVSGLDLERAADRKTLRRAICERLPRRTSGAKKTSDERLGCVTECYPQPQEWDEWLQAREGTAPLRASLLAGELLLSQPKKLSEDVFWRCLRVVSDLPFGSELHAEPAWRSAILLGSILEGMSERIATTERELLSRIEGMMDVEGLPLAEQWEEIPEVLPVLTRWAQWTVALGREFPEEPFPHRVRNFVRSLTAALDREGCLPFPNDDRNSLDWQPTLRGVARVIGLRKNGRVRSALKALRDLRAAGTSKLRLPEPGAFKEKDDPSRQSDAARFAVSRTNWLPGADAITVRHHETDPLVELVAFGLPILSGPWTLTIESDGRSLSRADQWSCVCWHTDEDGVFLELQQTHEGCRIERGISLSRTGRFAVLIESVFGGEGQPLQMTSTLPMWNGCDGVPEEAAGVLRWTAADRLFRSVTMSQGDAAVAVEENERNENVLRAEWDCETAGCLVTVLDWNPLRQEQPIGWRSLTVTETGERAAASAAAAYRVSTGDQTTLVYRSLKKTPHARSALGHQTRHETVIGEFDEQGDVTPLLLVDPD